MELLASLAQVDGGFGKNAGWFVFFFHWTKIGTDIFSQTLHYYPLFTPWKINMESEHHPIAKENHLPNSKPWWPCSISIFKGVFWIEFWTGWIHDLGRLFVMLIFSMIMVMFNTVYEKVSAINAVKLSMTMPILVWWNTFGSSNLAC